MNNGHGRTTPQSHGAWARCRRGPMGRGGPMAMMKGEKARDFKGTMRKLIQLPGRL